MDIEQILNDVNAEFEEIGTEVLEDDDDTLEIEDEETEDVEEVEEEEADEEEVDEEEPSVEDEPPLENEKQYKAFQRMREENQRLYQEKKDLEKYQALMKKVAESSGMEVDEVVKYYENKLLEDEAKTKGVAPEVIQLQREVEALRVEREVQAFNAKMEAFVESAELSTEEISEFFEQCAQNNIDLFQVGDIASVYKGLNFEKVLEKELSKKQQEQLEKKKQRMETTGIVHGSQVVDAKYDVDKDVEDTLKKFNVF